MFRMFRMCVVPAVIHSWHVSANPTLGPALAREADRGRVFM